MCSTIDQPTRDKDTHYSYAALHLYIHSLPVKIDNLKLMITELDENNIIIDFIILCETLIYL